MCNRPINKLAPGFTLLEILLAMFIFTIVSMIIVGALHSVFTTQATVEARSKRIGELQLALLFISRDLEQTVNRAITAANGGIEPAFSGTNNTIVFTHTGVMNPQGILQRSSLQRVRYYVSGNNLIRETWAQLDQTHESRSEKRILLKNVDKLSFNYFDQKNQSFSRWPSPKEQGNLGALPKGIKMGLNFPDLGSLSQFYIIPGQTVEKTPDEKNS